MDGHRLVVAKNSPWRGRLGIAWESDGLWRVLFHTHVFILDSQDEVEFIASCDRIKELMNLCDVATNGKDHPAAAGD